MHDRLSAKLNVLDKKIERKSHCTLCSSGQTLALNLIVLCHVKVRAPYSVFKSSKKHSSEYTVIYIYYTDTVQ